jgi:hypothetical protein
MKNKKERIEEILERYRVELDEAIEDMAGYSGKMLYEDALFERLLKWGRTFLRNEISTLITSLSKE